MAEQSSRTLATEPAAGGASVCIAMTLCDETLEDRIQRKGLTAPAARAGATRPPSLRSHPSALRRLAVLIVSTIKNRGGGGR